ncbi:MAG: sulfite exporter TauE/SafE family protein [Clostridia bacterium]|nr:sulfite exporter TauE/SafE family protein [Clostridia bacterium]
MYVILVLVGLLSGIITGMGLGGIVLIPALTMLLDFPQKMAQGINLVYFIPTSLVALFVHNKNKNLDFKLTKPLAIWGVLGAFSGSMLVGLIPAQILRKIFAVLLVAIGIYQIITVKK